MSFFGLFNREKKETLDKGLEKSKESVLSKIGRAIAGKSTIDDEVLDNWDLLRLWLLPARRPHPAPVRRPHGPRQP